MQNKKNILQALEKHSNRMGGNRNPIWEALFWKNKRGYLKKGG